MRPRAGCGSLSRLRERDKEGASNRTHLSELTLSPTLPGKRRAIACGDSGLSVNCRPIAWPWVPDRRSLALARPGHAILVSRASVASVLTRAERDPGPNARIAKHNISSRSSAYAIALPASGGGCRSSSLLALTPPQANILFHHSITLFARASSVGGNSRPSAFAVVRLTTSSNTVGCST